MSKGHSGIGQPSFDIGGGVNLFDVGWKGGDFGECLYDPKKDNGKETPEPKPEQ